MRCIFARPGGLELDLVLRAVGVQAEAAGRQSLEEPDDRGTRRCEGSWLGRGGSELDLTIEIDGRKAVVYPFEQSASGGEDEYTSEFRVAVDVLPSDGRVTLITSWPRAGLAKGGVTLTLATLDGLEDRVVQLPKED
ncbi:hypothetical protein GCM10022197_14000 [Microlunatus spumicola]|uniref:Uncharacterized protein n=1 Tax=Microlunatus spumicola TaxID=81499 RepID=A0ABP6X367_9ACTN